MFDLCCGFHSQQAPPFFFSFQQLIVLFRLPLIAKKNRTFIVKWRTCQWAIQNEPFLISPIVHPCFTPTFTSCVSRFCNGTLTLLKKPS
uniref:Uncharacterized protein n=1 Tax=Solanum lycopersicum TaxID=4081 RepID=A0A3Q7HM79_SOLLC